MSFINGNNRYMTLVLNANIISNKNINITLGDGYFEQQLVIDQISKLIGKPYLSTYGSDMEQFKDIMDAGSVAAEEMNLQVGAALTAEQIASLTSDIVWLV